MDRAELSRYLRTAPAIQDFQGHETFDFKNGSRAGEGDLIVYDREIIKDGYIRLSEKPGMGVEINKTLPAGTSWMAKRGGGSPAVAARGFKAFKAYRFWNISEEEQEPMLQVQVKRASSSAASPDRAWKETLRTISARGWRKGLLFSFRWARARAALSQVPARSIALDDESHQAARLHGLFRYGDGYERRLPKQRCNWRGRCRLRISPTVQSRLVCVDSAIGSATFRKRFHLGSRSTRSQMIGSVANFQFGDLIR